MASQFTANNWLLDSEATNHITSYLANMSLHQPYFGNDEVLIGNGSSLAISHTGSSLIPSKLWPLYLTNILCVPKINKNLIYMLPFIIYVTLTKCLWNFSPLIFLARWYHYAKDAKNYLYKWPVTPSTIHSLFAPPSQKTSSTQWHAHLGHSSSSILSSIISQFQLLLSSSTQKHLSCTHCPINKSHKLPFSQFSPISY